MTWTAPRTWVAGEIVTAALLNAQVRDNELVLATVPTISDFSTPGTTSWSKPADLKWAIVEMWGGGSAGSAAGGGGSGSNIAMGAGGGAGAYCRKLYAASSLSSSESLTVGAGGSGNAGDGNSGVNTTFKTLTAGAGAHGQGMAFTGIAALANGGLGGTATNGDVNLAGDDGGKGQVISGPAAIFINHGGGSPFGGGISTFGGSIVGVGVAGNFPGGGGSGSFAQFNLGGGQNGPSGANGRVLVTNFFS